MVVDVSARIDALVASTESLLQSIKDLTDDRAREASLMPDWSRGHVLTHIARNADAMINLATWARTGTETLMYASREQRNTDIAAGSGRSAVELTEDVRTTHERMLAELRELPVDAWSTPIRWGAKNRSGEASAIPFLRRTEVEVHHVDLSLDYTLAHLPEDFVEDMLVEVTREYSADADKPGIVLVGIDSEGRWTVEPGGPEVTGPPPSLLGWLLGRTDGIGLHSEGPLPMLGAWR
ncbi:MAG: maleylpyruvate isomerase family mycothiol-dependent enzyme [Nocardioidaceae bacterium]